MARVRFVRKIGNRVESVQQSRIVLEAWVFARESATAGEKRITDGIHLVEESGKFLRIHF